MIAYLSVEKNMMRFRTEDKSIDVYFCNIRNVSKICKVSSFIDGIIKAKVRESNPFGMENSLECSKASTIEYDMRNILELLEIPTKALGKITKVKVKKSDDIKDKYYFKKFIRNGISYIEVTDNTKKYRSVYNADNMNLLATTMTMNMINEYANILKYHSHFSNTGGFIDTLFDADLDE